MRVGDDVHDRLLKNKGTEGSVFYIIYIPV